MHRSDFDLLSSIVVVASVVVVTLLNVENTTVHLIFALPLVLLLPGYALTRVIFPDQSLEITSRFALSIGLSMTVSIIGGLVLDKTDWGLNPISWLIWLGGITIPASLIGWRKKRVENSVPLKLKFSMDIHLSQALFFGMAIGLVIVAMSIARDGALEQLNTGITQFWMLPMNNGNPNVLLVGVTNQETSSVEYQIQVEIQDGLVADWSSVKLDPGENWETTLLLPPKQSEEEIIKAFLYRLDSPGKIYRQVHIWRSDL